MKERSSYRAGDRLRVAGLPPSITTWVRPKEFFGDSNRNLQNGDIITLIDPPTRDRLSFPGIFEMSGSGADFGLNYEGRSGFDGCIPADLTEPVAEGGESALCVCDIMTLMVSGCNCGYLSKEKKL
jgi:hypothetical protein